MSILKYYYSYNYLILFIFYHIVIYNFMMLLFGVVSYKDASGASGVRYWFVYYSRPGGFFRTSGRFLLSSFKHFDQSNNLLPLKSMVNPSNLILFQKKLDCSLLALQTVIQKT